MSHRPTSLAADSPRASRPFALASEILQEANDCGNVAANPDHQPLRAEFELGSVAPAPTRAELLQRIEAMERQIVELKGLIQSVPSVSGRGTGRDPQEARG